MVDKQKKRPSGSFSQITELVRQVQGYNEQNDGEKRLSKSKSFSKKNLKGDEKRFSSHRAMSPTKHFTQTSYYTKEQAKNLASDYEENLVKFHQLLQSNKLVQALQLLDLIIERESGRNKIKTLVILSDFYIKNNYLDKALLSLHSTILYVQSCKGEVQEEYLCSLIFKRALVYLKLERVYEASQELSSSMFQKEENQPASYWTIYGDCLFKEQKYQQAYTCFKNQL